MNKDPCQAICWTPLWNDSQKGVGIEHLLLAGNTADSVVVAIDQERGPFRLAYRLWWDAAWQLHSAELSVASERSARSISLQADGQGQWKDGLGQRLTGLDGCLDIDIWPTPFTNSFPIRRRTLAVGERQEFRMAWVFGPDLTIQPQPQAYTRTAERRYLFESLDGSGFKAELAVDEDGLVLDYPGLFKRVKL